MVWPPAPGTPVEQAVQAAGQRLQEAGVDGVHEVTMRPGIGWAAEVVLARPGRDLVPVVEAALAPLPTEVVWYEASFAVLAEEPAPPSPPEWPQLCGLCRSTDVVWLFAVARNRGVFPVALARWWGMCEVCHGLLAAGRTEDLVARASSLDPDIARAVVDALGWAPEPLRR